MAPNDPLDPEVRREVVAFLRGWLPPDAVTAYRRMIQADPSGWYRSPHFQGKIITRFALRGNGLTEERLGVRSLEALWPGLLREAVLEEKTESDQ